MTGESQNQVANIYEILKMSRIQKDLPHFLVVILKLKCYKETVHTVSFHQLRVKVNLTKLIYFNLWLKYMLRFSGGS